MVNIVQAITNMRLFLHVDIPLEKHLIECKTFYNYIYRPTLLTTNIVVKATNINLIKRTYGQPQLPTLNPVSKPS